jgi:glutathione S-transferase
MLKIWGRANSINVQKVLWVCEELALFYDRVDAGMQFGVVNTPEYRALNPNALVPTIDDDGFVLWESNAIVRYLAAKYGAQDGPNSLWPDDAQARASADRWMDWQQTTLWGRGLRDVFWALVRTPPEQRDAAALEAARVRTVAHLGVVETALAGQEYLCGDELTVADIPMGCALHRWFGIEIERPPSPMLEAYYRRLGERPAYRQIVLQPLS